MRSFGRCPERGEVFVVWCGRGWSAAWSTALVGAWAATGVAAARAQGPVDAALHGRVLEHGVAAAGAAVVVTPLGMGPVAVEVATTAAVDGGFLVQRLMPGFYRVVATAEDGASVAAVVEVGAGEWVQSTLETEDAAAPLSAEEEAAMAAQAEVEPAATEDLMRVLPVEDRAVVALAQLDPLAQDVGAEAAGAVDNAVPAGDGDEAGVRREDAAQGAVGSPSGFSFGGLAGMQNGATVDGLSAQQSFRAGAAGSADGGANAGVAAGFGQGAVRSLRVLPHTFSARYGGAAGGVMAVATRTAAAHLHGAGFVLERASALAAANPFSVVTHYRDGVVSSVVEKPVALVSQLGGSIGAPLTGRWAPVWLRARAGALASVEVQLRDDHIVSTPAAANFYALSAGQVALLGNRGVGVAATNAALNYLDGLSGVTARAGTRVQGFGRVDARVSARDEVTFGYNGVHFESPAGAALGQASEAVVARGTGSLGTSKVSVDAGMGRWLRRFSERWNNEVRAQVVHDLEYETPHAALAQEPSVGPGGYAPEVSIAPDGFAYGTPTSLGRVAYPDEWRVEVADDVQVRLGHHLLTVGGDWSRLHDWIASTTNAEGAFSYDSGTTSGKDGGLVDWITDYTFNVHAYPNGACPSIHAAVHYFCFRSFTQSFGALQTTFVTHELAGFVEDAWQVRDGLSITAGVRYDYTLLPLPQTPNTALDSALAGLALPVRGATATFPEDQNNVGPRVGVAWVVGRRRRAEPLFTAHLGYGWFYGRVPGATVRAALAETALASSTLSVRIRPTTITQCPQVTGVSQGFGYACSFTSTPPAAVAATSAAVLFAERYRLPAVQRAELSLERAVGRWAEVRVSYALALATQLPDSVDENIAPATGMVQYVVQGGDGYPGLRTGQTFTVPLYTARRLAAYGPVTMLVSDANATYHAGTVEAHGRGRGVEVRASYTFSRSIDYGAQAGATPALNGQFDPFRLGYDRGLSSQQVPQRFVGSLVWEPRFSRATGLAGRLATGWRVGAIAVASSGSPYSYQVFGGTYLSGGRESINGAGGATYLPSLGRNTLRLPTHGRLDVRLQRGFALGEKVRGEAFVEAFNLLNTQTIAAVQTRAFLLGTPATTGGPTPLVFQDAAALASEGLTDTLPFGAPRSSSVGFSHERQLELGLRVRF